MNRKILIVITLFLTVTFSVFSQALLKSYLIPVDADQVSLKIHSVNKQKVKEQYNIAPPKQAIPVGYAVSFTEPNPAVYESEIPFPYKPAEIVSDEFYLGYRIVTVRVYPFEYLPESKELYACTVDFSFDYTLAKSQEKDAAFITQKQTFYRYELNKKSVKFRVENPEVADDYDTKVQNIVQGKNIVYKAPHNFLSPLRSQAVSVLDEIVPDYIIITCDSLKPAFKALADWKTKKGVFTVIKTIEEIAPNYQGCDLQEKIRNYIIESKNNWGHGLYVLLGGGVDIVPARMVNGVFVSGASNQKSLYPTDMYYATYENSWNANRNNRFNEYQYIDTLGGYWKRTIDLDLAKYSLGVILGRIPVNNIAETNVWVNKILTYERANNLGDLNYLKNNLYADAYIGDKSGYLTDLAMKEMKNFTEIYVPSRINNRFLCDNSDCNGNPVRYLYSGANCYGGDLEFNRDNFLSCLNTGANFGIGKFHFVYHIDHSGAYGMATSGKDKGLDINRTDIDNLENGPSWQILMSGGCSPANFQYDCMAKHFLTNPNGGGLAFIGNTDIGWSNEYAQLGYFLKALYTNYPNLGRYDIGSAYQYSLEGTSYGNEHAKRKWRLHLLGDPEMQVWTNTPENLQVSFSTQTLVTGKNTVTVTINNGFPAGEGATICLQKGDEVYEVKSLAQIGNHTFTVNPQTSGTMNVTVTAHDFIPHETNIPVVAGQNSLYVSNVNIIDDGTYGSNGNGNGKIEAGETIALSVDLTNSGLATALDVSATLSSFSSDITINTPQASFTNIAPGATSASQSLFLFTVNKDVEEKSKNDMDSFRFSLNMIDDNEQTYESYFNLDVFAPEIEQGNKIIVTTNNGNTNIEPNETVQILIELTNIGGGDATGLEGVLSSSSPYVVSCSPTPLSYPVIGKNETKTNAGTFQFIVSNDYTDTSLPLNFTLEVKNKFGKIWTFNFNLVDRPDFIPSGAISSIGGLTEIELFWSHTNGAAAYNVYRSNVDENGVSEENYVKLNNSPVSFSYFKNSGLARLTKYAYKISAVSESGNESDLSETHIAWTSYPTKGFFPVQMSMTDASRMTASINVADVNNDGYPEIFAGIDGGDTSRKGYVIGLDHEGVELFSIKNNITHYDGFAEIDASLQAPVAIGNLYANEEMQIVSVTRDVSTPRINYVTCHAVKDTDGDHQPDMLWQNVTGNSYIRGAVIANVDNSSDGSMEIILKADGNSSGQPDGNRIQVLGNTGNLLYSFGAATCNYSAMAVADLDEDGDKEIIAGFSDGVYVWHHNGNPYSVNPVFSVPNYLFNSSPIVCDLDGCGQKEILIVGFKKIGTSVPDQAVIFALKQDDSETSGWKAMPGWGVDMQTFPVAPANISQEISVGDLYGDGHLSVVALGVDALHIWDRFGISTLSIDLEGVVGLLNAPVIADVDGDDICEIIAVSQQEGMVYGIKPDGTSALGFPLRADKRFDRSTPCVVDLDMDGKNEVIAASEGKIYVWETKGNPNRIEWGSERCNPQNTGEYVRKK